MEPSARKPKQPPREEVRIPFEPEEGDEEELPPAIEPPVDHPSRRAQAQAAGRTADGSDILTPEEEASLIPKSRRSDPQLESYQDSAFRNIGGGVVRVDFEAGGRFSMPESLHMHNYQLQHITDISLSRPDDTLEVLIHTVQKMVNEKNVLLGQALIEEFLELMIGVKRGYYGDAHTHRWSCTACQADALPSKRKLSEALIDLSTVKMIPIETADEMFRKEYVAPVFEAISDEQFDQFLRIKYGQLYDKYSDSTRELEIAATRINDVIKLPDDDGNMYEFRFTRIGDLVEAYKLALKEYGGLIRVAKSQVQTQVNGQASRESHDSFEAEKEREIERLELEKGKTAILYSKALSLCKLNGRELSVPERLKRFTEMDWRASNRFSGFHEAIKFGVYDEREVTCNLCGHTDKELLQQRFNPIEFVPESNTAKSGAGGKVSGPTGSLVFFGA